MFGLLFRYGSCSHGFYLSVFDHSIMVCTSLCVIVFPCSRFLAQDRPSCTAATTSTTAAAPSSPPTPTIYRRAHPAGARMRSTAPPRVWGRCISHRRNLPHRQGRCRDSHRCIPHLEAVSPALCRAPALAKLLYRSSLLQSRQVGLCGRLQFVLTVVSL